MNSKKSADAYRTISEVADMLELKPHVLRFWEKKFVQIKPIKRDSGRRYYRPEDVRVIQQVKDLLYTQGYTVRGVQQLFKQKGVRVFQLRDASLEFNSMLDEDVSLPQNIENHEFSEQQNAQENRTTAMGLSPEMYQRVEKLYHDVRACLEKVRQLKKV